MGNVLNGIHCHKHFEQLQDLAVLPPYLNAQNEKMIFFASSGVSYEESRSIISA